MYQALLILFVALPALADVDVCYAPTNFADQAPAVVGVPLDRTMEALDVRHAWIRTSQSEAGMGLREGTLMATEWSDHTGRSEEAGVSCFPVQGCDTSCVEESIQLGDSLGLYGALNTCHDAVVKVFAKCGCEDRCLKYHDRKKRFCKVRTWPPLGHKNLHKLCPLN